ncbi:MAG: electron transfer flavoprotein subunit beta/FixA family protein [Nitrososphaerales archaeon]
MLIIALLKGVPARTTQVSQIGGVLNREAMDLVLNPHDLKAIEAADFLKRRIGGKTVALTMGPDMKLIPLLKPLYDAEVMGVDEEYVLSDRKMAGADTWATAYAVSLGVRKLLEMHTAPIDEMIETIRRSGYSDTVKTKATALYQANLLPNRVYSDLPPVRDSIVERFLEGATDVEQAVGELTKVKESLSRFIIVSGIKTTDGETGSVGPQVAEGVSELLGRVLPHATYVEDFEIDDAATAVVSERKIGRLLQKLEMTLPALLTISAEYRPRECPAALQPETRYNNYRGKILQAKKWTADDLAADEKLLGLAGSPTIVGTGIDVGKPPVQKFLNQSLAFLRPVPQVEFEGKKYGPFEKGQLAADIPQGLAIRFREDGSVGLFDYAMLAGELFD